MNAAVPPAASASIKDALEAVDAVWMFVDAVVRRHKKGDTKMKKKLLAALLGAIALFAVHDVVAKGRTRLEKRVEHAQTRVTKKEKEAAEIRKNNPNDKHAIANADKAVQRAKKRLTRAQEHLTKSKSKKSR